jgi:hypothetical protein
MGYGTFTRDAHTRVQNDATAGGSRSATSGAEERQRRGQGLDPLVDPKGLTHLGLGPIRQSCPRFELQADSGLWKLTVGTPMLEETLLDTTGSMGDNVEIAFGVLPDSYDLMTAGSHPVLKRYDVQIINACFGDVQDQGTPILCRTQAEMDVKIAQQLTMMVPSKNGGGNGKEDPQFGLFAAAYLTAARINQYGLKRYHFTVSDEPVYETIDRDWLKQIFGDEVVSWAVKNGHEMSNRDLPDTAKTVKDLQTQAHAFFLQVGDRHEVRSQWSKLYGPEHFVAMPGGTKHLHYVKACIIGLTEGVLDLESAQRFLRGHKLAEDDARMIVRAVAHIPLGAQKLYPNFDKLPKAGSLFKEKTDLWPIDAEEAKKVSVKKTDKPKGGPGWL